MVNTSLCTVELWISVQRKLVSDSSGLRWILPKGQVNFLGEIQITEEL